jgi:hypothetical protein
MYVKKKGFISLFVLLCVKCRCSSFCSAVLLLLLLLPAAAAARAVYQVLIECFSKKNCKKT